MWRQRKPNSCEGRSIIMWMNFANRMWSEWRKKRVILYDSIYKVQKQAQLIPGWWNSGQKSWKGVVTVSGQERFLECWRCSVSSSAYWLHRCVQFLKTCGAVHIWCVHFSLCILCTPEKENMMRIHIYWYRTQEDMQAPPEGKGIPTCTYM